MLTMLLPLGEATWGRLVGAAHVKEWDKRATTQGGRGL